MNRFNLNVHCVNLPTELKNVAVGPQKGKEVDTFVYCGEGEAKFLIDFRVKKSDKTDKPNFLGTYAHGTVVDRFFYLVWMQADGEEMTRFARTKIKLSSISWELLNQIGENGKMTVTVNCQKEGGGLIFATPPQENIEWQVS